MKIYVPPPPPPILPNLLPGGLGGLRWKEKIVACFTSCLTTIEPPLSDHLLSSQQSKSHNNNYFSIIIR